MAASHHKTPPKEMSLPPSQEWVSLSTQAAAGHRHRRLQSLLQPYPWAFKADVGFPRHRIPEDTPRALGADRGRDSRHTQKHVNPSNEPCGVHFCLGSRANSLPRSLPRCFQPALSSPSAQGTHLPSSSPSPSSKMRWAPSSSSLLSTYFPMALKCS